VTPHDHTPGLPSPGDGGSDTDTSQVFEAFRRVMHLNRQLMMRMVTERGGHPGQSGVLPIIAKNEGISQRELADMLHLSPPTVTAMLQKMERNGLVERHDDPSDLRITRLKLTDAGRALNDSLRESRHRFIAVTVGALSSDDQREFARILRLMGDNAVAELKRLEEEEATKR
jgi:DNA-binding MarR family transcriptional regulator